MAVSALLPQIFARRSHRLGHLEYTVAEHCNLTCVGCDHDSPASPPKLVTLEAFKKDLIAFRSAARVRELRILGGEPLLHKQLVELLEIARSVGVAERIVVFTNGVLLGSATDAFFDAVDSLYISRYPGVVIGLSHDELVRKSRKHKFELHVLNGDTFNEVLLDVEIKDKSRVARIYETCTMARNCHTLHEGRFYKCPVAPFLAPRLRRLGQPVPADVATDSIAIHGDAGDARAVDAYLKDSTPLAACRWCHGSTGKEMPNTQARARPPQRRVDGFAPPRFPVARRRVTGWLASLRRAFR